MTVAKMNVALDQLSTPVAVLHQAALEHNLAAMATWCAERRVELVPHGKTTMAPQLFARQLARGATGIAAATPDQVRTMRRFGVPAVQLANQLVQAREAAWIAAELARDDGFAFSCWVDSAAGVRILESAGAEVGVTFDVLLEVGVPGGRTGCRSSSESAALVEVVRRSPHVRLIGVAGYEGAVAGDRSPASMALVRGYLRRVRAAADQLLAAGAVDERQPIVLTAGGSMFFDVVAEELSAGWADGAARVVLRSGCYIAHDHGLFHRNSPLDGADVDAPLRPALTVWGTVLSRPEPGRAFLDVGRRHISFDQGLPVPLRRVPLDARDSVPLIGAEVTALNDQHAYLRLDGEAPLDVGDRVQLGVSHPCTTFDKWRQIPVGGADGTIVDVVDTYF